MFISIRCLVLCSVLAAPSPDAAGRCQGCAPPVASESLALFAAKTFDTSDFPPRWQCGSWSPLHGWLHIVADALIWFAYLAIPCVLIYFVYRRRELPFRGVFVLFGAFILLCGATHLLEAMMFWWPAYRFMGIVKLLTAVVSLATVMALIPIIPKVLALKSPEELEREVRQRNIALGESRAKTEFLANMSHEIRTPMTAILGFAETMLEPQATDHQKREAAITIRRNGTHLLSILNDVLDLSKIEAGRLEIETINCSTCKVLREVVALMTTRARSKQIDLDVEFTGPVPSQIRTDPVRLRQVLMNLMGNAVKFTATGGVRLEVCLAGDRTLQLDVIDTGVGLSPEQAGRLFQNFVQADATTTRQFGGSGLGLAISKRLARLLGGDVWIVETELGVGTRFRFTIDTGPLGSDVMIGDYKACVDEAEVAERSLPTTDRLDARILLAEDGRDNQRLITHILRVAGAEVDIAANGVVAIERAEQARGSGRPYDVILMDMQMPELDGYDATRALRTARFDCPIIALTAHAMSGDRDKCLAAGCNEYVTKPIDREGLIEVINTVLSRASSSV